MPHAGIQQHGHGVWRAAQFPITEAFPTNPLHPYAQTKLAVEWLLQALEASEPGWRISRLRYFNPVGAHPSGRIGEDPQGIPNNLFPCRPLRNALQFGQAVWDW